VSVDIGRGISKTRLECACCAHGLLLKDWYPNTGRVTVHIGGEGLRMSGPVNLVTA
jgi:hypothetical protein